MNNNKEKYCSCVLKVAKKNTQQCNRTHNWKNKCYNPYAICAKSVKTSTGRSPCYYDFNNIPIDEVIAYINLNYDKINKTLSKPIDEILKKNNKNTEKIIKNIIQDWYDSKK